MSKNIVVSKIRCENPNKRNKTPALNRNNLMYVATRKGVDLTPSSAASDDNSIYVRYISERPRSHGLFGNLPADEIDDLDSLCSSMYQLSKQQPVFKGILSLTEEDAKLLGYDKKNKWESTLRLALPEIAEQLKIRPTELQWVAAFHQEKGHPHVHYMLWSSSDRIISPYIHTSTQNKCRELFSKYIFEEERDRQVVNKTIARDDIITSGKELIRAELEQLFIPGTANAAITGRIDYEHLSALSKDLLSFCSNLPAGGRLAYKFLPPEQKKALDHIVEQFLAVPALKGKYTEYQNSMKDIMQSYSVVGEKELRKRESADADLKKRLGNVILKELKNFRLSPNPDPTPEQRVYPEESHKQSDIADAAIFEPIESRISDEVNANDCGFLMTWTKTYKEGRSLIYAETDSQKTSTGIKLLESEANRGNVLALYDLAHIYETGLAGDEYMKKASSLYGKALAGFQMLYNSPSEDMQKLQNYISYRIGKHYLKGQGCDMDLFEAASWLEKSSNQYAQYSLAKIYLNEESDHPTVPIEKVIDLLESSSNQGFGYASYQLGVMYEQGKLVAADEEKSFRFYEKSLSYFKEKSNSATDSFIFFRLGFMYYHGKGTAQNLPEAIRYFEKAASLGDINALLSLFKIYSQQKEYENLSSVLEKLEYHLGKLNELKEPTNEQKHTKSQIHYHLAKAYIDETSPLFNLERGTFFYQLEAENGNHFAQYQLGKIFATGDLLPKNLSIAISYLSKAAEQGNVDAQYQLGKIYSDKDSEFFDITKSISFFTCAASERHSFSQYSLGKIYSDPELNVFNLQKAISYFNLAAEQGNEFALYNLGTIYANKNYDVYDIKNALKFYHCAIDEFNNSAAKYQLGRMYLFGTGVEKNVILGMEYLNEAAQDGNEYAAALISFYQRNQVLYVSYTIYQRMLNIVTNDTFQNRQLQRELSKATSSKKLRKELSRKNQIKSSEPDL